MPPKIESSKPDMSVRQGPDHTVDMLIIFPRHQIWHLSYNLVTPIEAHGYNTKCHIFNQKAQQESSVLQDCGDIKIMYMSHDRIFISIELTPNGHMTLLVVQGVTKKCMALQVC